MPVPAATPPNVTFVSPPEIVPLTRRVPLETVVLTDVPLVYESEPVRMSVPAPFIVRPAPLIPAPPRFESVAVCPAAGRFTVVIGFVAVPIP